MKRKIYSAFALAAAMMLVPSCSSDEDLSKIDQATSKTELSLSVVEASLTDTRIVDISDYAGCQDIDAVRTKLKAHLILHDAANNETFNDYIDLTVDGDGNFVTKPITLAKIKHTVKEFRITDPKDINVIGDDNDYYKAVEEGVMFSDYVNQTIPFDIDLATDDKDYEYTKPKFSIDVLCAEQLPAEYFVKPKFEYETYTAKCIPIFADICSAYGDDIVGEDIVAEGTVTITKYVGAVAGVPIVDTLKSGEYAQICFKKYKEGAVIPADETYKLVFNITNGVGGTFTRILTAAELNDYEDIAYDDMFWDDTYNFLDVYLCESDPCESATALYENFDKTSKSLLTAKGWEGLSSTEILVETTGGNPDGYLLMLGNKDHKTDNYSITTPLFKYTKGQKIQMDYKIDLSAGATHLAERDCLKKILECASVKATLIDAKTDAIVYAFNAENIRDTDGKWKNGRCDNEIIFCYNNIPDGCYKLQLDIVMPGAEKVKQHGCETYLQCWYDYYNFGIDNLESK